MHAMKEWWITRRPFQLEHEGGRPNKLREKEKILLVPFL
jgi:hypothetical protein